MDSTRISLARVLELGVHVTWREAVAITLQAAAAIASAKPEAPARPSLNAQSCTLTRGGDVRFEESSNEPEADALVVFFRETLTDPETPPELQKLSRLASPEQLLHDLEAIASHSKRRRVEVASVAIRGLTIEAELARRTVDTLRGLPVEPELPPVVNVAGKVVPAEEQDAEFNRLRAMVGNLDGVAGTRRRSFRRVVDLRAVVGVGVPLLILFAWWLSSPAPPLVSAPPRGFALPSALRAVPLVPDWASEDRVPVIPVPEQPASPPATSAKGARSGGRSALELPAVVPTPTPAPVAPIPAPTTPTRSSPSPAPRGRVPAAEPPDPTIYSASTPGVEPPVLRAPNLPNAVISGAAGPIGEPYFDVLVDQAGRVETVRLRGRPDQSETYYRHRMMLAAAKAWQFAPATRDGRPVRFAARIVLRP